MNEKRETVNVHIVATRTVIHDEVIKMTRKQWEDFKALNGEGACDALLKLIDLSGGNQDEIQYFEAEALKEDCSPFIPADEYEFE